jgi:hypothetical protein
MRYSTRLAVWIGVLGFFIGVVSVDSAVRRYLHSQSLQGRNTFQGIVTLPNLGITTAARYLRHYSLSDLATPFQDYPVSQEHFPASFAFAPADFSNMSIRFAISPVQIAEE